MSSLRSTSPKRARAFQIVATIAAGVFALLIVNSVQSESATSVDANLAAAGVLGLPTGQAPAVTTAPIPTTAPLALPTPTTPPPTATAAPAPAVPPTVTAAPTPEPTTPEATTPPTATPTPAVAAANAAAPTATAPSPTSVPTVATAVPTTGVPQAQAPQPTVPPAPDCDPDYSPCIGLTLGDALDCEDLITTVEVIGTDHHNFDGDGDGLGCEQGDPAAAANAEPAPAATATPVPTSSPTPVPLETSADLEIYVLGEINQVRANAGLGPVALDPAISSISRDWSQQMGLGGFFDHRPSSQLNVMLPAGWREWGENIASAPDIFYAQSSLEASPGHYANMVGNFTHVGIGVFSQNGQVWVTQNFARY